MRTLHKTLLLPIAGLCLADLSSAQTFKLFVDSTAPGPAIDGLSWTTAFLDLQSAIDQAAITTSVRDILVAEGTYSPTKQWGCSYDGVNPPASPTRNQSFVVPTRLGLGIHGGFKGYNGGNPGSDEPDDPDGRFNNTILSGATDNNYHVLVIENTEKSGVETVIDGFRITGGLATSTETASNVHLSDVGAGVLCLNAYVKLENVTIRDNNASKAGGGVYFTSRLGSEEEPVCGHSEGSSRQLKIRKSVIRNNLAGGHGGGVWVGKKSSADFVNVRFRNNTAYDRGGGIYIQDEPGEIKASNLVMHDNKAVQGGAIRVRAAGAPMTTWDNCTIAYNEALISSDPSVPQGAAGVEFDAPGAALRHTINNSIIYANTGIDLLIRNAFSATPVLVQYSDLGTTSGPFTPVSNISADPLFINVPARNLRLTVLMGGPVSPCANTGSGALLPCDYLDIDEDGVTCGVITEEKLPLDFDLTMRLAGPLDMGAYEAILVPL